MVVAIQSIQLVKGVSGNLPSFHRFDLSAYDDRMQSRATYQSLNPVTIEFASDAVKIEPIVRLTRILWVSCNLKIDSEHRS